MSRRLTWEVRWSGKEGMSLSSMMIVVLPRCATQAGRGLERAQSPRLAPVAILTVATSLRGFATYNRYPSFNA